jgi:hypothetical protein
VVTATGTQRRRGISKRKKEKDNDNGYLDTEATEHIGHIALAAASTGAVKYGNFVASV